MSQFQFRMGLFALAMTQLLACQKFSKSFQEKAFNCGIEPNQFQSQGRLLQIVDRDNQTLSPTRLQALQAGVMREGQWNPLSVSRGGCVVVDAAADGALIVQDPVTDEAAYASLDQLDGEFTRLTLHKRRAFSMRFSCPADAYAADERLELNAFYAGDGEAKAGLWLAMTAQKWNAATASLDSEPQHILWNESLDRRSFPQALSIQDLPEGTYKIMARAGYMKPGQSFEDLDILGNREGCLLRIMRQMPEPPQWRLAATGRRERQPPELVIPVRQPLDLIRDPELKLEYCVEPLEKSLDQCAPQRQCKGPEAVFHEAETIALEDPGHWAVFVRSRDAARHLSPLTCASVQASNTAPSFSVDWAEPEWNQPFPLLALPPVTINASISDLKHEVVGRNYLEESLECRVTVTSSLGNSRDAYYARCLSGRCAGRALRDWQPCSPQISIDLSQEWMRSENWETSLALHVRASDQAGHAHVVRKNLWFSGQRLVTKPVLNPLSGEPISYGQMLQKKDGTVIATADGQIVTPGAKVVATDPSITAMIGQRKSRAVDVFEDLEGVALWAFWTFYDNAGPVLGKKSGANWVFNPQPDQGGPDQTCEAFGQSHQGALMCLSPSSLAIMDEKLRWQKIPLQDASLKPIVCETSTPLPSRYTESSQARWFICDKTRLLVQASGQNHWQTIKKGEPDLLNFGSVLTASTGELWVLGDQGVRSISKVFVQKNGIWEDRSQGLDHLYLNREEEGPTYDLQNFHEMATGTIRYGTQLYNADEKRWISMLPDSLRKYEGVAQDKSGGLWTIVDAKALLRFYPKPSIIPLEMLGLTPGSRIISVAAQGSSVWVSFVQTGHVMYYGSAGIFHLESLPWQSLSFGFARTPAYGEGWTDWVKDFDGNFLVQREDGEFARLDPEQGWSVISMPSERPADLKKNVALVPQGENFLAQTDDGAPWLWDGKTFTEFPWATREGVTHNLRLTGVDGLGRIWNLHQQWRQPLTLYRLNDRTWETYPLEGLPENCLGPLVFFEGDRKVLNCGKKGPVVVDKQALTFLAAAYPELKWESEDLLFWLIPVADKTTPFIFFTTYHGESDEQFLHRYEPGTGQKRRWKLVDDRRLHIRGDMMTSHVSLGTIVLDQSAPDRFLISSFRYILRPDGDTLKVAMDGNRLLGTRGIKLEPQSGVIRGLDIQRQGEVWILMRELGLVRYDSIWQAEDKEETPVQPVLP